MVHYIQLAELVPRNDFCIPTNKVNVMFVKSTMMKGIIKTNAQRETCAGCHVYTDVINELVRTECGAEVECKTAPPSVETTFHSKETPINSIARHWQYVVYFLLGWSILLNCAQYYYSWPSTAIATSGSLSSINWHVELASKRTGRLSQKYLD
jgi:hypothetical protein